MPAPRLLPKSVVNATLAQERKQEIDKGIKLAKAIEILRETKVTEQQELELFRIETIRKVQIEIDALLMERDRLKKQIEALQALQTDYGRS